MNNDGENNLKDKENIYFLRILFMKICDDVTSLYQKPESEYFDEI